MYTRILIPLDGSSLAEQVLPYGRFLGRALRIPVHLLRVTDENEMLVTVAMKARLHSAAGRSRSEVSLGKTAFAVGVEQRGLLGGDRAIIRVGASQLVGGERKSPRSHH